MRRFLGHLLGLGILFSSLPALADNLTNTDHTFEYHLPNGLKLIVREDHRAPVVISSVWYKVGGAYENDGGTGISHVMEHMMFNGTKRFARGELIKMISDNGGQQNAMTLSDYTLYYQLLAKDKLPISFELEADRMQNLLLNEKIFERELKVVMEERRMRIDDDPRQVALERFYAAAYVNNPYHHPVIGWMTDVKHLTLADVKNWYREWYEPNNAVVIVVGDVQAPAVEKLAIHYFGGLKPAPIPKPKPRKEIQQLGERSLVINIPAKLPWLMMGYNTPSLATTHENWKPYALLLASYILGTSDSSRLPRDLVRGQQIATDVSADYSAFQLYNNLFVITATPAPGHSMKELRDAVANEIEDLQKTQVTTQELNRAKAQIVAQNVYQNDSDMDQAFNLGIPEMLGMSWRDNDRLIAGIETITPQQVQTVAQEYFNPEQLTMAVLLPRNN